MRGWGIGALLAMALLAGPVPATQPTSDGLLDAVNAARAKHQLPPLTFDAALTELSQGYAETMVRADCLEHDCGGQGRIGQRAYNAGVPFRVIGEALAGGPPDVPEVVALWMSSATHRAILLNPEVTLAGIGYAYQPEDGGAVDFGHYWVLTVTLPE